MTATMNLFAATGDFPDSLQKTAFLPKLDDHHLTQAAWEKFKLKFFKDCLVSGDGRTKNLHVGVCGSFVGLDTALVVWLGITMFAGGTIEQSRYRCATS